MHRLAILREDNLLTGFHLLGSMLRMVVVVIGVGAVFAVCVLGAQVAWTVEIVVGCLAVAVIVDS